MELFLPGLLVLLISAIFVFMILPRMGPIVLSIVSIITVIAVILHHNSLFASEYRLSTWQNAFSAYTPFLLLGIAIMMIVGVATSLFSGSSNIPSPIQSLQSGIAASMQSLPSAASATNTITSAINSSLKNTKSLIPALGYRASNV